MSSNIDYHRFRNGESCVEEGCRARKFYIEDGKKFCQRGHEQTVSRSFSNQFALLTDIRDSRKPNRMRMTGIAKVKNLGEGKRRTSTWRKFLVVRMPQSSTYS